MQIIGITGITGSGKSTVSRRICEILNAKHIDADRIAKELSKRGEEYYNAIIEEFGREILNQDYEINRKKLAEIVFSDLKRKKRLDEITCKYVVPKIIEETKNTEISVLDVPLLFESGLDKICSMIIGVIADKDICINRIIERDGITREEAQGRINSQNDDNFFKIHCNYCIFNNDENNIDFQISDIFNNKNLSNKNVIQVVDGKIRYLQFRKLLEYSDRVQHCFSLRPLDFGNNDNYEEQKERIHKDYEKICQSLKLNSNLVYRPYQMHTNVVKKVENEGSGIFTEDFQDTDGLITNKKDKVLSISVADCISLLFYDPIKNVIGDIHSGWKGTYQRIAKKAIEMLKKEYGCDPNDLICCIGPSIKMCCFEVSQDVRDMFYERFKESNKIGEIIKNSNVQGKYYVDTVLINRIMLEEEGIKPENIIESDICTNCNSEYMHSFRIEKKDAGRNTAIICLK